MTIPTEVAASCPDCHSQNLGCYNATAQLMVCNDCAQIIDTELSRRRKESALTKAEAVEPAEYQARFRPIFADAAEMTWSKCTREEYENPKLDSLYDKRALYAHAPPAVPVASVPDGRAPTDDEIDALTDHLYRSLRGTGTHDGGMVGVSWNRALFRKALQVAAREDATGVVPDGWRDQAASWLESKAAEQEINNWRWPVHADAYPSWRERPEAYRILARELRFATPPTNQEGAAP